MAANNTKTKGSCTPRMKPKRVCARRASWKLEDLKNLDEDNSEDSFLHVIRTTPEDDEKYTPPPMSVFEASKLRMLCPSEERVKTPRTKTSCPEDYDPENDAFINDKIKVKFNTDSLKSSIKHFMQTADVPAYKQAISNCFKKKSSGVKKRRTYKKKTPKPEPEVELDPADDVGDNPYYASTPPGALRAMLYAKHIFQRILAKRKYLVPLVSSDSRNATGTLGKNEPSHALGAPEQSSNCEKSSKEGTADDKPTCSSTSSETPQVSHHRVVESEILKGVVAYVDFICHEDEDISCVIRNELMKLGAEVVPTFTKNDPVSVVLFNDGHISTYKKAKKRGIPLVSVLWIEECRRIGTKAPVSQFPPSKIERYESPEFVEQIKKRKLLYGGGRIVPRKERKRARKIEVPIEAERSGSGSTVPEYTPQRECPAPDWVSNYSSGNGSMKLLVNMTGVNEDEFKMMMNEPEDSEKYETSPLPIRLLHKLARGLNSPSEASLTSDKKLIPSTSSTACSSGNSSSVSNSILTNSVNKSYDDNVVPESYDGNKNLSKHKESKGTTETPRRISRKRKNINSKVLFH